MKVHHASRLFLALLVLAFTASVILPWSVKAGPTHAYGHAAIHMSIEESSHAPDCDVDYETVQHLQSHTQSVIPNVLVLPVMKAGSCMARYSQIPPQAYVEGMMRSPFEPPKLSTALAA